MAFIYRLDDTRCPSTRLNNETYVINFTGPGTITVDGEIEDPIDELDGTYTQAELDAEFGAGRGGIRIASLNVAVADLAIRTTNSRNTD